MTLNINAKVFLNQLIFAIKHLTMLIILTYNNNNKFLLKCINITIVLLTTQDINRDRLSNKLFTIID